MITLWENKSAGQKKVGEKERIAGNLTSRTTNYWTLIGRIEGVGQIGESVMIEGLNKQSKIY